MKLKELIKDMPGLEGTADPELEIGAVHYDSRKVTEGSLFVAITGFATDGNNLDEIGIYQVTDGNANAMKTVLEDYLEDSLARNQSWYESYIPKEIPKLRDAEVKVFGNYVIYAICSKEDRAAVFSAVADLLKQN